MEIRSYCNITLKLHERELLEEFESTIGSHREVRSCYHLAGSFDYLVEVYEEMFCRRLPDERLWYAEQPEGAKLVDLDDSLSSSQAL